MLSLSPLVTRHGSVAPGDAAQTAAQPKKGNSKWCVRLMTVNGGFTSWINRNLIACPLSTSASRTLSFQTHSPRLVPSTGCTVKASSNERRCMHWTLVSVQRISVAAMSTSAPAQTISRHRLVGQNDGGRDNNLRNAKPNQCLMSTRG